MTTGRDGRDTSKERQRRVTAGTELMIEGFPRSGNSFAVTAFRMAQDRPVMLAHHRHIPADVIAAVRQNVPVLILIRDPEEAVLSLVIRQPWRSLRQGLIDYIRFYKPILPYRDKFLCVSFEEVVSDFGSVIARLNQEFGTSFNEFEHSHDNVRRCFELLDQWGEGRFAPGATPESMVTRPSEQRRVMKDALRDEFRASNLRRKRNAAYQLYEALTGSRDLLDSRP